MDKYLTSDIQIAALLLAEGIDFLHVDNTDLSRQVFVFRQEDKIADIVSGFWRDEWHIAPRRYMGAYKELKSRLYHL